jgi:hypothetical protein
VRRTTWYCLLAGTVVLADCAPDSDRAAGNAASAAAVPRLDPASVPEELRGLVALAQEWGIGDDVERGAKVERTSSAERARLRATVTPFQERITAWLNSFGRDPMPDEAAAFMYLQLAIEEMPPS